MDVGLCCFGDSFLKQPLLWMTKKGTHSGASFLNILRYPGLSAFFGMVQCCRLTENMFPRSDIKTDSFASKKSSTGPFLNGPLN